MSDDIIKMFKKNVPRQKKVYQIYMQNNKIQNFSYANFKSNNVALIEIKDYLMTLDEYYHVSKNQIDNMFNYLKNNLSLDNFSKLKKVFKDLNDLSDFLSERYNSKDSLHGESSKENCLYIIDKIVELKSDIANKKGYNILDIENKISFEIVIRKILTPKEYVFDESKLLYLVDKFPFLLYKDRYNNNFNQNFCKFIEKAKINKDRTKLNYYKSMYNYLSTIKELQLDREYINYLLDINESKIDNDIIDKKIKSMRRDAKTGYRIVEDYAISIDTDVTRRIDDAFSIEKVGNGYLLGIHIADVYSLGYFKEDSFDINNKGNVKKANASLSKNKKRNAVTMYVVIDSNGLVRNCRILNTVLKTNDNLIYEDIPCLIRNDNINPELKTTVINLLSVYNLLENSRFPNNTTVSNFAYLITSKLMVLCCTLYSEKFKNSNIPAIYLCGDSNNNYYSLDSSEYYTGFEKYDTYTRVTSPIYETSSLINQFFINRYLINRRNIAEEEKDEMVLKLTPIVDKLNKNKCSENFD